jgi:valyl-tRNA synthetase
MMMFGLKFMNDVPFSTVYITGIIRDAERQKMSKSKGQRCRPAGRYVTGLARMPCVSRWRAWVLPALDIALSEELLDSYRAFATKIWNAARLIFRHVDETDRLPTLKQLKQSNLSSSIGGFCRGCREPSKE